MNKAPLLDALLRYNEENNLILSMPGNKSGKAFRRDELGINFQEKLGNLDITEVAYLDNLHKPEGVIKESEELLAKTYNVKKAFFLVNGSTSGNMASIFSAFNEGDEVLVERNCHKSIYNGLILRKLKVIYIDSVLDEENGILLPIREKEIEEALKKAENPKGLIITSPNYYGIKYNIEDYLIKLKNQGLKLIIDSAHGAHFGVTKELPKSLSEIGDYVVLSAHKTLPALTQGAYLMVNDKEFDSDFYIKAFMSTSPSYLIMASLDYARYYLDNFAEEDYSKLIKTAKIYKRRINDLNKLRILEQCDLKEGYILDESRYLIILKKGYNGEKLLEYFKSKKIQCEMSFERGVVLILSSMNTEEDFELIYKSIKELDIEHLKVDEKNSRYLKVMPKKVMEPYEVFAVEGKFINIEEAEGKIAKEDIIPYPPGIPLVCKGEVISKEVIEVIKDYLENNQTIIGIENNKVNVVV